jgi:hypothetical protein
MFCLPEEGLSEGWNPIQKYWKEPTPANRAALRFGRNPGCVLHAMDLLPLGGFRLQEFVLHGINTPAWLSPFESTAWTLIHRRAGGPDRHMLPRRAIGRSN